jgi:hypothetical protein
MKSSDDGKMGRSAPAIEKGGILDEAFPDMFIICSYPDVFDGPGPVGIS